MTSVRRVPRTLGVATIMRKARKMTAFRNRVELSVTPLECRRLLSISASYIGQAPLNEGGALHDTVSFTTGLVSDGIADYCITVTGLDLNKTDPILGREPGRGWDILHGGEPTTPA